MSSDHLGTMDFRQRRGGQMASRLDASGLLLPGNFLPQKQVAPAAQIMGIAVVPEQAVLCPVQAFGIAGENQSPPPR